MIGVWADDLSGALDTGAVFHRYMPTKVWPQIPISLPVVQNGAFVINTNTRHQTPAEIFERYGCIPESLLDTDQHYLKVDSALRGAVGITIEAGLRRLRRYRGAILCSAFPENYRTIIGGHLLISGRPAHHTAFSHDPKNPIHTDDIATLLGPGVQHPIIVVSQEDFPTTDWSRDAIYVADASTDEDLARLTTVSDQNPQLLPVGSAGWAAILATHWRTEKPPHANWDAFDRILAVVGSRHPVSRRQAQFMTGHAEWEIVMDGRTSSAKHRIFMTVEESKEPSDNLLDRLVDVTVHQYLKETASHSLLVSTGGDTTLALIQRLCIETLEPLTEPQPGVVLSRGVGRQRSLYLVSKSGAFGSPTFFADMARQFTTLHGNVVPSTTYKRSND